MEMMEMFLSFRSPDPGPWLPRPIPTLPVNLNLGRQENCKHAAAAAAEPPSGSLT